MSVFTGVNGHSFHLKVSTFSFNLLHRLKVAPRFGLTVKELPFLLESFVAEGFFLYFDPFLGSCPSHTYLFERFCDLGLFQDDW